MLLLNIKGIGIKMFFKSSFARFEVNEEKICMFTIFEKIYIYSIFWRKKAIVLIEGFLLIIRYTWIHIKLKVIIVVHIVQEFKGFADVMEGGGIKKM